MALDTTPISAAASSISTAVADLIAFAEKKIADATGETAAIAAAVAADEASAVAVLGQVSEQLTQLAASISTFIASHAPAPPAAPAS